MPRTEPPATRGSRLRTSFVALLLLAACQAPAEDTGSPAAAPLPGLMAVMSGLEQDMARLSRGLWRSDYDTIAAAARAVATHPKVPPSEAQQIAGILGPDMAAFKGVDTEIHDLAVRIGELAREEDMDAIVTAEARLRAGCAACHARFRTRIREALR